ncbi:MAG: phosphodiester glycosidase family protein [Candidatus Obscuribacterales bacterium]|nr:phosphodiester glycosidase family protein [Candidatus Obscuribacterales bacterium]
MKSIRSYSRYVLSATSALMVLLGSIPAPVLASDCIAIGVVSPPMPGQMRISAGGSRRKLKAKTKVSSRSRIAPKRAKAVGKVRAKKSAKVVVPRPPQEQVGNLSKQTLVPGVVYSCHRGSLNINVIDVDLNAADVEVRPVLAGETFNRLEEVKDQAKKVNAIAAVNANYFKHDGTPLGTLILDGEWIAGPLYERVAMGITAGKNVYMDRLNLHGTVETSNAEVGNLWVNNINQPRRTGSKLIVYTRRWGSACHMAYEGSLVAVDSLGRVVDTALQHISIPYGGFVLCDSKDSKIAKLNRGDLVSLCWHSNPERWSDVSQAVSGGPTLIRGGKLYLDLQSQRFKKNWTSNTIHARTAVGVTANRHLILVTVEGPHSLWDVAKMLQKLGCVEAMNLDGGGSTTMVVGNRIVTRNKDTHQRRVATSLAVLPKAAVPNQKKAEISYVPTSNLTSLVPGIVADSSICDPIAGDVLNKLSSDVRRSAQVSTDVLAMDEESIVNKRKKRALEVPKSGRWWQRFGSNGS